MTALQNLADRNKAWLENNRNNPILTGWNDAVNKQNGITPAATPTPAPQIPTGLRGSELALDTGLNGAITNTGQGADEAIRILQQGAQAGLTRIDNSVGSANQLLEKVGLMGLDGINSAVGSATGRLDPFVNDGRAATDRLKAFLGIGGPGTQQQAFDDFQMSPYAKFMQSEGEKGVLRNASATGNLGAGGTSKDLMRFNQGLASSELNNLMERLGFMSQAGQSAATTQSGIDMQGAGLSSGLIDSFGRTASGNIMQGAGLSTGLLDSFGRTGANIRQTQGRDNANYSFNYGLNKSNNRFRTGELLADRIAQTTDNLSGIQGGEANSIGDLVVDSSGNLSSSFQRLGELTGLNQQQLMTLLANISTNSASTVAGLPGLPGVQEQQGAFGRMSEAIGTAIAAAAGGG